MKGFLAGLEGDIHCRLGRPVVPQDEILGDGIRGWAVCFSEMVRFSSLR